MTQCIKCGCNIPDGELFCEKCSKLPVIADLSTGYTQKIAARTAPKPAPKKQAPKKPAPKQKKTLDPRRNTLWRPRGPILDGAALCAVIRSAAENCAGGIHFRRAFQFLNGFPQNACILWVAKQLDDLCIACTKAETEE